MSERRPRQRAVLLVVAAIGLGLAVAPAVFGMFGRAPGGGRMIDQFRPYMTDAKIQRFDGYMAEITAADDAVAADPSLAAFPAVTRFHDRWTAIDQDMTSMLSTMHANLANYRGVDALPPFVLFPWFFVLPGLAVAGLAIWALVRASRPAGVGPAATSNRFATAGLPPRSFRRHKARTEAGRRRAAPTTSRQLVALVAVGLCIVAAPAIFGMFSRAPGGADMIDDFRPLMATARVQTIQGYFLTIGAAEGQLRTEAFAAPDHPAPPAVARLSADWPRISAEMAPMIGTMSDNVGNFAGVAALPPFWLFPWFFVGPGLLVAALAGVALRGQRNGGRAPGADTTTGETIRPKEGSLT